MDKNEIGQLAADIASEVIGKLPEQDWWVPYLGPAVLILSVTLTGLNIWLAIKIRRRDEAISDRERWQAYNVLAVSNEHLVAPLNRMEGKSFSNEKHQIVYLGMMKLNNLRILFDHGKIKEGNADYVYRQFANETFGAKDIFERECFNRFEDKALKETIREYWEKRREYGKPLPLPTNVNTKPRNRFLQFFQHQRDG